MRREEEYDNGGEGNQLVSWCPGVLLCLIFSPKWEGLEDRFWFFVAISFLGRTSCFIFVERGATSQPVRTRSPPQTR